jgi:transmembrane sensor
MSEADYNAEIEAQARAWLVRMRSGKATAEDAQAFRRWCAEHPEHAHMAGAISDTWTVLQTAAAEFRVEREAARDLQRASQRARAGRLEGLRPGRRAFVGFAVAAGASWLALRPPLQLWPSIGEFAADYHTGTGEQRQVALSDRVMVEMNTQTRINVLSAQAVQAVQAAQGTQAVAEVNAQAAANARAGASAAALAEATAQRGIDLLAGEAEIVAAAPALGHTGLVRPIMVVAGRGRMQAQVARFNVRRTGDQVCVTCLSGSVAFEHPQQRLTLAANQQLVYNDRDLRLVSEVDPDIVTAWRRGLLVFNDVPLAQVVDEINRYRPGKLILRNADLGRRLVQAQFSIATLDDAVGMISKLYGARVTEMPGNIVLLS